MLLAINRFVCVVRPEKYTSMFSKKRSVAIAASAWIVTLVSVTIESFLFGLQFQNNITVVPNLCIPVISSPSVSVVITVIQNAYIAVPSLVVAVCYVKIYRTIRQHNAAAVLTAERDSFCLWGRRGKDHRNSDSYCCCFPYLLVACVCNQFSKFL